jgi:hypothetical protein
MLLEKIIQKERCPEAFQKLMGLEVAPSHKKTEKGLSSLR